MSWTLQNNKIVGLAGEEYDLWHEPLWYVVPARTHYSAFDGGKVRPLDFAMVLHNASIAKGLLISPTHMFEGMEPRSLKRGASAEAEALLEEVRKAQCPERPSRLCCYFLNKDKDVAELRMADTLRGYRTLVRCYVVLNGAKIHFADSAIYERLEGRPDDELLAASYWSTFTPDTESERLRLEIVADCALFFPDWKTFPTIPEETLIRWQLDNQPQFGQA